MAEVFGLDLDELAMILADFPLLDRSRPLHSPTTTTRDLLLDAYASRLGVRGLKLSDVGIEAKDGADCVAERVAVAAVAGEVAYVPGELAAEIWRSQCALPAR